MLPSTIREYLQSHRQEHLDALKEFVRFPSISAQSQHARDCQACAEWVAGQLRRIGLETEVIQSLGRPAVFAASELRPDRPTLLVYGHYDVQPPDPLELWKTDPFELVERGEDLVARGVSDDKGQVLAWVKAAEAFRTVQGDLPVNLKFFIEGEEEIGSASMEPFVASHKELLACDAIAISDTALYDARTPAITYGVRGLVYVEVKLTGPAVDLHSGFYGGVAINPINALAGLIARLHDDQGRITVPGFYDEVVPLTPQERVAWGKLPFSETALLKELGVSALTGEAGYTPLERMWGRPTLDCNGIWGGYTGEGPKTVLPSWAKVKLSCRLVPHQDPHRILDLLMRYFRDNCPPGATIEFSELSRDESWMMPADSPNLAPAVSAMSEAFEAPCALVRAGGSIPITAMFQKYLGVDPLMMGFGLSDDRIHSPNEKLRRENFFRGIIAAAALMNNLARRE